MLAYLFWHWSRAGADAAEYEAALAGFHRSLAAGSPPGFRRSLSFRLGAAPWVAAGEAAGGYEDWYVVDDSAALDPLNAAAVSGARRAPHDRAAAGAAGGAGGLYRWQWGELDLGEARAAAWLEKPGGVSYAAFEARLGEWLGVGAVAVWQRQMVLGPAPEYCVLGEASLALPEGAGALIVARTVVGG